LSVLLSLLLNSALAGSPDEITMVAGGDVMFGRYSNSTYRSVGGEDPFAAIAAQLRKADVAFVNLESPLMAGHPSRMPKAPRGLVFRGEAQRADQMVKAGIDVVSLANNHTEDLRNPGVKSTIDILAATGLVGFGAVTEGDPLAPVAVEISGKQVVFLGATTRRNLGAPQNGQWIASAYQPFTWLLKEFPKRVELARLQWPNALIIVSMHWGEEYVTSAPAPHQKLARALIDAGANGVLGHHPHVLQPVEVYKGAPILFSMGNLVFDQRGVSRRRTALFDLSWRRNQLNEWQLNGLVMTPVMLRGGGTGPTYATSTEGEAILRMMKTGAANQQTLLERKEGTLVWSPPSAPIGVSPN
jgi:poly-gamma-glutamate synthesis protein (capsule biosynthesis protein)